MQVENLQRSYRHLIVAWAFTVFFVSVAWWWFAVTPVPVAPPLMEIDSESRHTDALCPGDTLTYTVFLHVTAPGVYDIDISVLRVTPPATVIFSQTRRIVLSRAMDYSLQREWVIPTTHPDPMTGAPVPWLPGRYERNHGISAVGVPTKSSIATVPFEIAASCPTE